MRVTYTGGDSPQRWRYVPADVRVSEAQDVEAALGRGATWDEFNERVRRGDSGARRVLLWHLMRREHPSLAFADVPDFRLGDLVIEFDSVELAGIIDEVRDSYLPADRKERTLDDLERQLAEAQAAEAIEDVEAGKASGPDPDPSAS